MGSTHTNGSAGGNGVGTNLSYCKFLFVISRQDDEGGWSRLRAAGGHMARGFSNDFDLDDSRETPVQALETIQFFVREGDARGVPPSDDASPRIDRARHLAHVCSRYRPRLEQVGEELRRRLGDAADVVTLDGAMRHPRYSSAEMHAYESQQTPLRRSGRLTRNAIILPLRKSADWWRQSALERQACFYPHLDRSSLTEAKGHALAAQAGVASLFRRVYHNPDGYERPNEYDFVTYFECDDAALPTFDQVIAALRDVEQNPEWRFVEEGPTWQGRRVLRW